MRWIEAKETSAIAPAMRVALLRQAIERRPDDPALRGELGQALAALGDFRGAVEAFTVAARDGAGVHAWSDHAACCLELGLAEEVLALCRDAEEHGHIGAIHRLRGDALRLLGRDGGAEWEYRAALTHDVPWDKALTILLRRLAASPDGTEMLDFVDALPARCANSALARAHRAIALSRLGRREEAMRLVDLERHVMRVPFRPPASFDGTAQYNRILAGEIMANPSPVTDRSDFNIHYSPPSHRSAAWQALHDFFRASIEAYLAQAEERGLAGIMPPPEAGRLTTASVVLHGGARNGQHVHATGHVSCVYHVAVPPSVARAGDGRGALLLGCCDEHTGGYVPCWGTRHVKPVAGWLVIIPSHMFHDVVPPRSRAPRISVAADLTPLPA